MIDVIIVGCGITGITLAERISNMLGKSVLIIEQRNHIGGNCYDTYNSDGVLFHPYGPHIFHTDNECVWNYLSEFTDWHVYQHEVLCLISGKLVPVPFNLDSIRLLFPESLAVSLEEKLIRRYGFDARVPISKLMNTDDSELEFLADYIKKKVFEGYTRKQWGIGPDELDPEVTGRVPVVVSRDNRYFADKYQALPQNGYTWLFEKMLDNPNIKILLQTSYKDVLHYDEAENEWFFLGQKFKGNIIYTGMIDHFFNYCYSELPYRSLIFSYNTHDDYPCQKAAVVNYPENYNFTRKTEYRRLTGQQALKTIVATEYPGEYCRGGKEFNKPFYPFFDHNSRLIYQKYKSKAASVKNFYLAGRLADYKYLDMDDAVENALNIFEIIKNNE